MTLIQVAKIINRSCNDHVVMKAGHEWLCVDRRYISDAGACMIDPESIFFNPRDYFLSFYGPRKAAEIIKTAYENGECRIAESKKGKAANLS